MRYFWFGFAAGLFAACIFVLLYDAWISKYEHRVRETKRNGVGRHAKTGTPPFTIIDEKKEGSN